MDLSNDEIIRRYEKLCDELGRIATKKDIDKCDYICSSGAILSRFGSIESLRKESKVRKKYISYIHPSKEEKQHYQRNYNGKYNDANKLN